VIDSGQNLGDVASLLEDEVAAQDVKARITLKDSAVSKLQNLHKNNIRGILWGHQGMSYVTSWLLLWDISSYFKHITRLLITYIN
jgi:hypothetical protein